jgi:RNA polymerase sigma-70 factor (ECF subfamily)
VWRAVPAFRGGAQSSTFVYRVAHNAALTWRRSQRTYVQQLARFETMAAADPTSPHPGPVGTDRAPEALEHVYAAIRRLPPVDRSLILLHLDGVSYAGIAEIHGLSETNVGARLTRLKQKLTATLETIAHELR